MKRLSLRNIRHAKRLIDGGFKLYNLDDTNKGWIVWGNLSTKIQDIPTETYIINSVYYRITPKLLEELIKYKKEKENARSYT